MAASELIRAETGQGFRDVTTGGFNGLGGGVK